MVFCNIELIKDYGVEIDVTILILIDGFLQSKQALIILVLTKVTILILIDGFLQSREHLLE